MQEPNWEAAVATAVPAAPMWNQATRTMSRTMFTAAATMMNSRGRLLSPMPRRTLHMPL